MQAFNRELAETDTVEAVVVTRWEQYKLSETVPFRAMWYEVPAGGTAPLDQHPERELSVVVRGTAAVETGGATTLVEQGSAFLLDGGEAHRVRNRSTDTPLLIFSAYWNPGERSDG